MCSYLKLYICVIQVADSRAPLAAAYTALLLAHATYADTKRVDQKLWQLYYRVIDMARDARHVARDAILQVFVLFFCLILYI